MLLYGEGLTTGSSLLSLLISSVLLSDAQELGEYSLFWAENRDKCSAFNVTTLRLTFVKTYFSSIDLFSLTCLKNLYNGM